VKIRGVTANARRKAFEVVTARGTYVFPYAKCAEPPASEDRVREVTVDADLASEAFTYRLESGGEGTVHIDHVLEYNEDPSLLRDLFLYRLTLEAQQRLARSRLSKREIVRRLGTSATQLYRLLDQTNYGKSVGQLLALLRILDCEVAVVVRHRHEAKPSVVRAV
jgi:hypothetical protein